MDFTGYEKIGGFYRSKAMAAKMRGQAKPEAGLEFAGIYEFTKLLKKEGNEQNKVFAYSKVCNASKVVELCTEHKVDAPFKEPWLNVITVKDKVVAYVWDTREIIHVVKDAKLAAALANLDYEECVADFYDGYAGKPMLVNPNNLDANDAIELANGWFQPTLMLEVADCRYKENDGRPYYIRVDISTAMKGHGWVYIGGYDMFPLRKSFELEMDYKFLKEVWPHITKKCEQFTVNKYHKPLSFIDIQYALLDGLTIG